MSGLQFSEMIALVVGGTSGIGLEIAAQLAEAGVQKIILNSRSRDNGDAAVNSIRQRCPAVPCTFVQGDATAASTVDACMEAASASGGLDVLVNAVPGNTAPRPFMALDPLSFDALIDAHLGTTFRFTHAALPLLRAGPGGVILNIASDAAKIPTPGETVHGALMAAIVMFSRTLALEEARHNVRVHALTPSLVAETISHDRMMAEPFSAKLFERARSRAYLGLPTPEDLAAIAVFLCGPAAARMTGQVITVNGGLAVA